MCKQQYNNNAFLSIYKINKATTSESCLFFSFIIIERVLCGQKLVSVLTSCKIVMVIDGSITSNLHHVTIEVYRQYFNILFDLTFN